MALRSIPDRIFRSYAFDKIVEPWRMPLRIIITVVAHAFSIHGFRTDAGQIC